MQVPRWELFREVMAMAIETLRANRLRSALTVLGIVIGVSSIVGMTSLVRGFDQSLQAMLNTIGPSTMYITKFSLVSLGSGKEFIDLLRRPNLSLEDATAISRLDTIGTVDIFLGGGLRPRFENIIYGKERTKRMPIIGATEKFADAAYIPLESGRFFTRAELTHRRRVIVLGRSPAEALFPHVDPIGKKVRVGNNTYEVVGAMGKRPSPGGFELGQDEFAVIPYTNYQVQYGLNSRRIRGQLFTDVTIVAIPKDGVERGDAVRDVETTMRIRHGLRVDEENDFDVVTQEAAVDVFEQITQATFLALIALSSIALLVGGIGVMAIMTIAVTERTQEIGLRKALGARRQEILWQFLLEAVALTSIGGVAGVLLGSGIGYVVHWLSAFPISLPWWSFAMGLGFSGGVGILFGMLPALRASRLDPIEALRHE